MEAQKLAQIGQEAISIIKTTGAFIRTEGQKFDRQAVEVKSKNSLVSYVDKTAEKQLVEQLGALLPESGFIAEEGTSSKRGSLYNWIIDPLDGTTNFIHSLPCFSVSVALQEDDNIIFGVVYEINLDECFFSWQGEPAYLNGQVISVSNESELEHSLVATGFPYYDYDQLDQYMQSLQHFMHHTRGVRRMGSAAVDLAYVACGRFEGFYEYGLHPWDVAAGAFIVQQAGGKVVDFQGGDDWLHGKTICTSGANFFPAFHGAIKKFF